MSDNIVAIVTEETYDAPVNVVWQAITDKDRMRKWFFEPMTDFVPEVGFSTKFTVHYQGTDYPHVWKITEVIPQQKIVYDWRYEGFSGESTVTWDQKARTARN